MSMIPYTEVRTGDSPCRKIRFAVIGIPRYVHVRGCEYCQKG